jgi:CRP-like cAMP-binding protein
MEPVAHFRNKLLTSLAVDDFNLIRPYLRTVELPHEDTLLRTGDVIKHVYFPHDGVISLVLPLSSGDGVEIAMVGRDSALGAFAALGEPVSLSDVMVLIPGTASVVDVEHLRAAIETSSRLRTALIRHQQALFVQAQQSAGCNAAHPVEARLARWLLRARDLSGRDRLNLTQELMAQMIGARRNSVSIVAHTLQQSNLIRYSRGHIEIVDPDALVKSTCECYEAVKVQCERLIGSISPQS